MAISVGNFESRFAVAFNIIIAKSLLGASDETLEDEILMVLIISSFAVLTNSHAPDEI